MTVKTDVEKLRGDVAALEAQAEAARSNLSQAEAEAITAEVRATIEATRRQLAEAEAKAVKERAAELDRLQAELAEAEAEHTGALDGWRKARARAEKAEAALDAANNALRTARGQKRLTDKRVDIIKAQITRLGG